MRISDWSSTCALPICASMKVIYHPEDMQERFALKDYFRSRYGYKLGRKVAWFSGKSLLRPTDLASGRVWRDDHINKIRFFSTFHIGPNNFEAYWRALRSEAHTSELQSLIRIQYSDFCQKKKK